MAYKLKSSIDSLCGSPAKAIDPMYNGKKGVQQADFEQFSSAAKMNAEKGTNPIYNLSGKKGLQPSNNPAAAYMTGSPVKHLMGGTSGREVKHSHNDTISTQKPSVESLSAEEKAYFDTSNAPTKEERLANEAKASKPPTPAKTKPERVVRSSNSNNPPPLTQGDAAKLKAIKAKKNNNSAPPEALTGGDAVRLAKINQKKKASEPKEMSRKQIREAKKKDKDSGMSRKQVRANKLKRKADSAKAKTNRIIKSIDPTKAKSADTGAKQRKAKSQRAKTIRLEQKAAKFEGKVKASKIK
tara:strand:+ start:109 stop:1002 length:894 start_codon:yes stop_codon:yes gene_type:complete